MKKRILLILIISITFFTSCKNNDIEIQQIKDLKSQVVTLTKKNAVLKKEHTILDANKKVVTNFYQEFFGNKDLEAGNKYIGDVYIQHNPSVADGRQPLIDAVKVWLKDVPKQKINFNMVFAEKDLVFVQITETDKNGTRHSTMDVFRVTDGKISEHWDAFATFKKGDKSENDNPLF